MDRRRLLRALAAGAGSLALLAGVAGCGTTHVSKAPAKRKTASPPVSTPPVAPQPVATGACGGSQLELSHVSGTRLIATTGQAFAPNGITVFGLSYPDTFASTVADDVAQITEAAKAWCTNYVRLQLSQAALLDQAPYDSVYLQAVKREVSTATALGQNVILTDQTEHSGNTPLMPNSDTVQFWKVIASQYAGNPRVWFDLFNEPRAKTSRADEWSVWQDGNDEYVGFQQLAQDVRSEASNLIIVEGPRGASTLQEIPQYPITTSGVVYAVHPYDQNSLSTWQKTFGETAATYPVLVTEWSEYASSLTECNAAAMTIVPSFLAYLKSLDIGLGAWALVPGVLVTNDTNFTPTIISPSYSCNWTSQEQQQHSQTLDSDGATAVTDPQGAGALIRQFFYSTASGS